MVVVVCTLRVVFNYFYTAEIKMLCEYRNVLGEPGEGFHTHVFGIAIFDVLGTILAAILIAYYFRKPFWIVLFLLLIVGELLHFIFCVH